MVIAVFLSDFGMAGYLPPQILRHVRTRATWLVNGPSINRTPVRVLFTVLNFKRFLGIPLKSLANHLKEIKGT